MDLNKLTNGEKILGAASALLVIILLVFPWHSIDVGFASFSRRAIQSPNALWGWLALLLAAAVLAQLIVRKFTTAQLPELPISWDDAQFYGSIATGVLVFIKLISETEFLGFGAWLGVLCGIAVIVGGVMAKRETAGTTAPGA